MDYAFSSGLILPVEDDSDLLEVERRMSDFNATRPHILGAYREEIVRIAHWMAKVSIGEENAQRRVLNRELQSQLIRALEDVAYDVVLTRTPVNARKDNFVFVLGGAEDPGVGIEKPHKGRIVLYRAADGELYIPHPDTLIPVKLSARNINSIEGPTGKNIRRAFYQGKKSLLGHRPTSIHVRREGLLLELADAAVAEAKGNGRPEYRLRKSERAHRPSATRRTKVAAPRA